MSESAGNQVPMAMDALQTARRLECLLDVAKVINSSLELEVVLDKVLSQAKSILGAESGSVMLVDATVRKLQVVAAKGPRAQQILGRAQALDEGVAGWVIQHGEPLLLLGSASGPYRRVSNRPDVRDALCTPLRAEDQVLGVLSLSNGQGERPFDNADLDLLVAISHQAAMAIRNARAFEALRAERKKVEALLDGMTQAQTEERQRLALLLHDGPAQTMYAALRNLDMARILVGDADAGAREGLSNLEQTIRQALSETRAVMMDLWPPRLEEQGLNAALQTYAQQFEKRTGIKTRFSRRGLDLRLPHALESCLYRTVQESLTNVWKHADAKNARVVLSVDERACQLEIRDDGRGFDPNRLAEVGREHLGLGSLRERAEMLGGSFQVQCSPGEGTTVSVSAPIVY